MSYQIIWEDRNGQKMSIPQVWTKEEKDEIMKALAAFNPTVVERKEETIQTVPKINHKPVTRGERYLVAQTSFCRKEDKTGEKIYWYMIPNLGHKKISKYLEEKWTTETADSVDAIGIFWLTVEEIRTKCKECKRTKLSWLVQA